MDNTTKKAIKISLIALGAIFVIAIVCSVIVFTNTYRSIKVAKVEGNATVERPGIGETEAVPELLLENNDTVTTMADSRVFLFLDDDKCADIEPKSIVHIEAKGSSKFGTTKTTLVLEQGEVINEIKNRLGKYEKFEVETPSVTMAVRGTIFTARSYENVSGEMETYIEVRNGTVEAFRDGEPGKVKIKAGYCATISESDKIKDIKPEEAIPYFDFGFDINDITLFGESPDDLSIDYLQQKYDITHPCTFGDGEALESPDSKMFLVDMGDVRTITAVTDEGVVSTVFQEDSEVTIISRHYSPSLEGIDSIITPIIPYGSSAGQVKEQMHINELDELADEQGTARFKCNWGNGVYFYNRESVNGTDESTVAFHYDDYNFNIFFSGNESEISSWDLIRFK